MANNHCILIHAPTEMARRSTIHTPLRCWVEISGSGAYFKASGSGAGTTRTVYHFRLEMNKVGSTPHTLHSFGDANSSQQIFMRHYFSDRLLLSPSVLTLTPLSLQPTIQPSNRRISKTAKRNKINGSGAEKTALFIFFTEWALVSSRSVLLLSTSATEDSGCIVD